MFLVSVIFVAALSTACFTKEPTIYILGGSHGYDYSESKDYIVQRSSVSDEIKKMLDKYCDEQYAIANLCEMEKNFSDMINNGEYSSLKKRITEEDVVVVFLDSNDMKKLAESDEEKDFLTTVTETAACVVVFPPYGCINESNDAKAYSDNVKEIAEEVGMWYNEYIAEAGGETLASKNQVYPIFTDRKMGERGYDFTAYNRCGSQSLASYVLYSMSENGLIDGSFFDKEMTEEEYKPMVGVSGGEFIYNIMRCAGLASTEEEALSKADELKFTEFENKEFIPDEIISTDEVVVITCRIMNHLGYEFGKLSYTDVYTDEMKPYYTKQFADFAKEDAWQLIREGRFLIAGGINQMELYTICDMYDFIYDYAE